MVACLRVEVDGTGKCEPSLKKGRFKVATATERTPSLRVLGESDRRLWTSTHRGRTITSLQQISAPAREAPLEPG